MNNSQLIVYTLKEPLYCCCHLHDSLMTCSSNKALLIWDFAEGKIFTQYLFPAQVAPISITAINSDSHGATLLLQLKQTKVLVFILDIPSKSIIKTNEYQLQMIGFTKLSFTTYMYDIHKKASKKTGPDFMTIRYNNFIQRRSILSGIIKEQIEVDQTKFEEISFLLTYNIEGTTYFLVVEEGATFKQFVTSQQLEIIEVNKQLKIQGKSQVNILLSIEPTDQYRGYACLRNENIYLINLKQMQLVQQLSIRSYRIIKSIPQSKDQGLFAISSKNQICILKDNAVKSRQKIEKCFILDLDTFQFGVICVTQEGKIAFLPFL